MQLEGTFSGITTVLQVYDQVFTTEEIIPLLTSYKLLPQLLRGMIIDQAIASPLSGVFSSMIGAIA